MRRGATLPWWISLTAVLALASCKDDDTLPEPMDVGGKSKSGKSGKKTSDDAPNDSAAVSPEPVPPSSCSPQAGQACFVGAEVEHAAVMIHHVTGANVVVAGSYDKRIDGVIPTTSAQAAFAALAKQAELSYREIDGVHYLGAATVIDRGPTGTANFCRENAKTVQQRVRAAQFIQRVVEDNGRRVVGSVDGEVTVALDNTSPCNVVQHLIHMAGANQRVEAQALRITGDAALPKSPRAAQTVCAPLDTDKVLRHPCHGNADLSVVGVSKIGEVDVAVIRRTSRVYEPVELVKPGEHVGDYHTEVGTIDATGLKSAKGNTIVFWSP